MKIEKLLNEFDLYVDEFHCAWRDPFIDWDFYCINIGQWKINKWNYIQWDWILDNQYYWWKNYLIFQGVPKLEYFSYDEMILDLSYENEEILEKLKKYFN